MSPHLIPQAHQDQSDSTTPNHTSSYPPGNSSNALNDQSYPHKRARIDCGQFYAPASAQQVQNEGGNFDIPQDSPRPRPISSISSPNLPTFAPEQNSLERPITVPEQPPPSKARRKPKQLPQDGSPFIIEAVSFPDHQPWLKVRPRRKRAAVEVTKDVPLPNTTLPEEGEVLSLDKDADRIAVLIAQKRMENESSQFRQRMATQQRVHRGELDTGEELIMASNNELKRKMELGAQGIFEDKAPNGKDPSASLASHPVVKLEPDASTSVSTRSAHPSTVHKVPAENTNPRPVNQSTERHSTSVHDVIQDTGTAAAVHGNAGEDDTDEDETEIEAPNADAVHDTHEHVSGSATPQTYLPYQHDVYYQSMAPSQMAIGSHPAQVAPLHHIPHHMQTGMIYQQPALVDHQQQHYVSNWFEPQPPIADTWTQQIFHSLPSTQTPVMQATDLSQRTDDTNNHPSLSTDQACLSISDAVLPQQHSVRLFGVDQPPSNVRSRGNSESPEAANDGPDTLNISSSTTNMFNGLATSTHSATGFEPQPPVLRSNMNMFTRSARENGVIGGNNNIPTSPTTRRNMFASNR